MFDPEVLQILGLNLMAGRSPNFAENLGNAGLATMQYQRQREEDKYRKEEREFMKQQRQLQMEQLKRDQRFKEALSQGFRPGIAADPLTPVDDEGNPMPSSKPTMDFSRAMQIDPFAALQAQEQFRNISKPQTFKLGKDEVVYGADGRELFANRSPVKPEKPKFVKGDIQKYASNGIEYTREFDGENWNTIAKTPQFKPDAPEKPLTAPAGYQWNADRTGVIPIPGGPADYKVGKEAEAAANRQRMALDRAQSVMKTVQEAKEKTGFFTAGAASTALAKIAGTPAYDLRKKLDEVKANIGFQELQQMREASPTGGALGQVAVQELTMLQSVLGSLDANQSPEQLRNGLDKVYSHFNKWANAVRASQEQSSVVDDLVKKYGGS